jgi:hypothetical protein
MHLFIKGLSGGELTYCVGRTGSMFHQHHWYRACERGITPSAPRKTLAGQNDLWNYVPRTADHILPAGQPANNDDGQTTKDRSGGSLSLSLSHTHTLVLIPRHIFLLSVRPISKSSTI